MKRYEITDFDPASDDWTRPLSEGDRRVRGLCFKPRARISDSGDTTSIEVVFDVETLLPAAIIDSQKNGNRKMFRLSSVEVDPDLDEETRNKMLRGMPSPLPKGWKVHVEPLEDPTSEAAP